MTLKIAIAGAGGRMGRTLIETVTQADDCELHAVLEHAGSKLLGCSAAALVPGARDIAVTADLRSALTGADALIDFTRPEVTLKNLAFAVANNKRIVIGTTGFDDAGKAAIAALNETEMGGRKIIVNEAKPRTEKPRFNKRHE